MADTDPEAELEKLRFIWQFFAEDECGTYSPLYATISRSVAEDRELLQLIAAAPRHARQPNLLLAAVHYLLLEGLKHPLADVYVGREPPDKAPALFRDLCLSNREAVLTLISSRRTQTNECGRSAVLALGLARAAESVGEPIGLLDAGASAGLNLIFDQYLLDYGSAGTLGPLESPVRVACELRGLPQQLPGRLPSVSRRLGIDRSPVDLSDNDDVRWLLACVWPDTGRLERTGAAIELARKHDLEVVQGDLISDLDSVLDTFEPGMPVVVVTSWTCAYLSITEREGFLAALGRNGVHRPLAWLSAEGRGVVDILDLPTEQTPLTQSPSVLGMVTFTNGTRKAQTLGLCHAHGSWLEWMSEPGDARTLPGAPEVDGARP